MNGENFISEDSWKQIPADERDLIMFRMIVATRDDVRSLKRQKFVFHSTCSLIGGIIGGALATIGFKTGKLTGILP